MLALYYNGKFPSTMRLEDVSADEMQNNQRDCRSRGANDRSRVPSTAISVSSEPCSQAYHGELQRKDSSIMALTGKGAGNALRSLLGAKVPAEPLDDRPRLVSEPHSSEAVRYLYSNLIWRCGGRPANRQPRRIPPLAPARAPR